VEAIVSDNASTDETEGVCRDRAARDARVRYTRHPRPIGAYENFLYVLGQARADYFMWLPGDDYALPRLLERTVAVLDARPDVVCCVPQVDFLAPDGGRRRALGTFPLTDGFRKNVVRLLEDPADNTRFYGLYRRAALERALPRGAYYAFDWVVSFATLRAGTHAEVEEVLLVREASEPLKYTRMVDEAFAAPLARLFPLLPFSRALMVDVRVPPTPGVLYALLRLNLIHHVRYCEYRYPCYGRVAYRVGAALEKAGQALARPLRAAGARRGPRAT
jgi:glycosyltransferase involved in cell wall biosynthesis